MGLVDAYRYLGIDQALEILEKAADWFSDWTAAFSEEAMDDLLEVETGGMMEAWADLFGITGNEKHRKLMERYFRRRLFNALLEDEDVLTNMHANTTIPEAHGVARAYEVTGEERYRKMTEKYWEWAVSRRGAFCTGGQTFGELWTPPKQMAQRIGEKNQEHCTVYNMIRLADFLFRWSGEAHHQDYIERNLYNGILAQQHPKTGMITYFLPLNPGATKKWGSPTNDFWCCHGTLVQAHTTYTDSIVYPGEGGLTFAQYIPATLTTQVDGSPVQLELKLNHLHTGSCHWIGQVGSQAHRPDFWEVEITVSCESPLSFPLRLRIPEWVSDKPQLRINGEEVSMEVEAGSFFTVNQTWQEETLLLKLPRKIVPDPLPDDPGTLAFREGPVVLAALTDKPVVLQGKANDLVGNFRPDGELMWERWFNDFQLENACQSLSFKPLYEIGEEAYTVYCRVEE